MVIDPKLIIIRKPEKKMSLRKLASAANAIFFWSISIYLLFAVAGWVAGLFILESVLDGIKSIATVEKSGLLLLLLVVAIYSLIWLWSAYNRFRFSGKKDRRRSSPLSTVSTDAIGEYAGLSAGDIEGMRQAKIIICHFGKNRKLERIESFSR